jgi:hypothetical protein
MFFITPVLIGHPVFALPTAIFMGGINGLINRGGHALKLLGANAVVYVLSGQMKQFPFFGITGVPDFVYLPVLKTRTRRFGIWICFRPEVKGGRRLICWVP